MGTVFWSSCAGSPKSAFRFATHDTIMFIWPETTVKQLDSKDSNSKIYYTSYPKWFNTVDSSLEGIIKPKPKKSADVVARYKRSTKTIGCKARLILKYDIAKRTYHVLKFEEAHNHCLVSPTSRQFLLGNRKMTFLHKNFIYKNARVNIGPVKSFRLFKENVGGYENVGVTMQDFKNFHRDLKTYIKGDDGKMLIENFIRKRDIYTGFYFDYALDEEDHISRLFWADAISRKNYCLFGEMVTFNCNYNTNKYSMVLAPFTSVDHHKSCITFGMGLLAKEDSESFEWLFRTSFTLYGGLYANIFDN
ncbi:protein FAR1-RELATED SEQUENCE 5-like [Amaranthus tricolor]|uniref:protein FAR1-RELATED SEQUENCE 5-like n=1 Tax=Amaranthus tricolor TaxID=29722 RepID=UPI00258919FF|nr:protein FAR1-RELATED SEQUENCE 5-like [Amaranthus tricolor]